MCQLILELQKNVSGIEGYRGIGYRGIGYRGIRE
jgi:hypothetical protein